MKALDHKVYVSVVVKFNEEGNMTPMEIEWENGKKYSIDKLIEMRQASAEKAGGQGDRYTVSIRGNVSYLFFERSPNLIGSLGRWFVERR
ncbi:MAG: hypothetical protein ACRCU3_10610 [Eubacteriaceae bacterium]